MVCNQIIIISAALFRRIKSLVFHNPYVCFNKLFPARQFEFFTVNTKLPEMAILASKDLTAGKKIISMGLGLMVTGLKV